MIKSRELETDYDLALCYLVYNVTYNRNGTLTEKTLILETSDFEIAINALK